MDNMSDASGMCLQDLVNSQGQANTAGASTNGNQNDHLHNHHSSLHDSVAAAVSVSSAITGLMSGGAGGVPLGHLHHHTGHDLSGHHHHHHHHNLGPHTPSLHEPLEKLKSKCPCLFASQSICSRRWVVVTNNQSNAIRMITPPSRIKLQNKLN